MGFAGRHVSPEVMPRMRTGPSSAPGWMGSTQAKVHGRQGPGGEFLGLQGVEHVWSWEELFSRR